MLWHIRNTRLRLPVMRRPVQEWGPVLRHIRNTRLRLPVMRRPCRDW